KRFLLVGFMGVALVACGDDSSDPAPVDDVVIDSSGKADGASKLVGTYNITNASAVTDSRIKGSAALYAKVHFDGKSTWLSLNDSSDPTAKDYYDGHFTATLLSCTNKLNKVSQHMYESGLYQLEYSPEDGQPLLETYTSKRVFLGEQDLRFS